MRISDWSSDVCSSDLFIFTLQDTVIPPLQGVALGCLQAEPEGGSPHVVGRMGVEQIENAGGDRLELLERRHGFRAGAPNCQCAVRCRSEEHTSELQSLMRISYAVFCLKKKTNITN